jgi:3-phenylpropionate/cinnamic acid dioxygenase small subunit
MNPASFAPSSGGVPAAEWHAAAQRLFHEAEILDAGQLREWLALLGPAVDYRVLHRVQRTRPDREQTHQPENFLMACDRAALEARISRQSSEFAWSEETPPATRRFVSNVRVERVGDELIVKSNLLVFRARWEVSAFVSAERVDRWIVSDGALLLRERRVYLDHSVLPFENLGVFL